MTQEILDKFYFSNGPCCAGCDWWGIISALIGECTASAPVSGEQRVAMLGIDSSSLPLKAGHVVTKRNHFCGQFKDDFDWGTLPISYQKRIGVHKC